MLRERGHGEEAENVRQRELPALLATVRMPADTDATIDARLEATFAREAERVADAAVLVELMAPLLTPAPARIPELMPILIPASVPGESASPPPQFIPPPPQAPVRSAASIADFIDEMIAQETPPADAGPASRRRAS